MEAGGISAFDALRQPVGSPADIKSFSPHPDYDSYLRIHKILVGNVTAKRLEIIHNNLQSEELPRYLSVAGWAAAEAALAQPNRSAIHRNNLLEEAKSCWTRALENELSLSQTEAEFVTEASAPFRYALDLAHLPLLQAMVSGDITDSVRREVALDVLNIAEANAVQMTLAAKQLDQDGVSDHVGVGHECNALLAFHSLNSPSLIAIPSSARADSGHHHPHQTHDIAVIQQKWGDIEDITPVEIKSQVSQRDRVRYKALLVRGKMHLSMIGKHSPEHTLRAFSAFFNENQTPAERQTTDYARQTILDLYWLYKKGNRLENFASPDSRYQYRDPTKLHVKYPEIAPQVSV